VAGTLPGDVQRRILSLDNVTAAKVEVVWDPPWTPARMSEAAKLQLGIEDY
jgi:metal-sulfur cluster biosynthetic enzyme